MFLLSQERELSVFNPGPHQPPHSPQWHNPNGGGKVSGCERANASLLWDSDPVGIWCFGLQRAFLQIAPPHLPAVASQAPWHPCPHTRGSPTAGSFYFNQRFLHRLCSQLGLFLPAPYPVSDSFLSLYYFIKMYKESRQKSNHSVGRLCNMSGLRLFILSGSNVRKHQQQAKQNPVFVACSSSFPTSFPKLRNISL